MKIAVLGDSGCQIPVGSLESKGIFIVPLTITFKEKTYLDSIDITSKEVFDIMDKEEIIVKTSQPPTGLIEEMAIKIKKLGYDHIIALPIATGLSSTLQGIKLACDMADIPVTLIDTKSTAGNQKYLIKLASELIKENKELDQIVKILEEIINGSGTLIMAPNLEHLKRGGRITPAVALLGSMLKIVPVMKLNYSLGGKIDSLDKVRTVKKANLRIIDYMINTIGINNKDYILHIEHILVEEVAKQMKEVLIEKIGDCEVIVKELPAVVGAHMGKGGIGYQYIKKYKNYVFD